MITGKEGLNFIKLREGLRLTPYVDAGKYAIGYGNNYYENGNPVQLNDPPISKNRADTLFGNIITQFETIVNSYIKVELNQSQFDAIMSFAYNVGTNGLKNSTLLKKINRDPNDPSIRGEFMKWVKSNNVTLESLKKRRKEEADIYFGGIDINSNTNYTEPEDMATTQDDGGDVISNDDGGGNNNDSNSHNTEFNGIVNIMKPTIEVTPIVYNSPNDPSIDVSIGKLPFIWFNSIQIDLIEEFKLTSSDFLPTISFIFRDSYGYFDNLRFANDDDRVKVFIDSKSELLKPLFMEFKVIRFMKIDENIFGIDGILNVNKLLTTRIESFGNSTSFETIKKVAEISQLGFNTNISNTNDTMNWINPGNRGVEFCKEVIKKSYRNETSFMWGFVDFYYNLNLIDIESQLKQDITKQLGITTNDLNHIQAQLKLDDDNSPNVVYLSNDTMAHGTSNYFESYSIFNNSTKRSIDQGYSNIVKYYDWKKKDFLIFETESIKSNRDTDLILKSDDNTFIKDNVRYFWEGKMVDNNVHDNYCYTNRQNVANINEVQKIGMQVVLPIPNYNLYKFMRIYVLMINQGLDTINPIFNKKLSGGWLITDIQFIIEDNILKQKVKLIRRELGFSQEESDT